MQIRLQVLPWKTSSAQKEGRAQLEALPHEQLKVSSRINVTASQSAALCVMCYVLCVIQCIYVLYAVCYM